MMRALVAAGLIITGIQPVLRMLDRLESSRQMMACIAAVVLAATIAPAFDLAAGSPHQWSPAQLALRYAAATAVGAGVGLVWRLRRGAGPVARRDAMSSQ